MGIVEWLVQHLQWVKPLQVAPLVGLTTRYLFSSLLYSECERGQKKKKWCNRKRQDLLTLLTWCGVLLISSTPTLMCTLSDMSFFQASHQSLFRTVSLLYVLKVADIHSPFFFSEEIRGSTGKTNSDKELSLLSTQVSITWWNIHYSE